MLIRVRCPKNPDGFHVWQARRKDAPNGLTFVGFVCICRAVQYIDLV